MSTLQSTLGPEARAIPVITLAERRADDSAARPKGRCLSWSFIEYRLDPHAITPTISKLETLVPPFASRHAAGPETPSADRPSAIRCGSKIRLNGVQYTLGKRRGTSRRARPRGKSSSSPAARSLDRHLAKIGPIRPEYKLHSHPRCLKCRDKTEPNVALGHLRTARCNRRIASESRSPPEIVSI
jgi:hypothetical protein